MIRYYLKAVLLLCVAIGPSFAVGSLTVDMPTISWSFTHEGQRDLSTFSYDYDFNGSIKSIILLFFRPKKTQTDINICYLMNDNTTKKLDLSYYKIHDTEAIGKSLQTNTILQILDLRLNKIGDKGAQSIGKALAKNRTLQELYLGQNVIDYWGAQGIAEGLKNNGTLRILGLRHNQICNGGAIEIGVALEQNSALKELDLGFNQIHEGTISGLWKSLQKNNTLETLYLGHNRIGNTGVVHFAGLLENNNTLKKLSLRGNKIDEDGAVRICRALEQNATLKILDLRGTLNISEEGITQIGKSLWNNYSLTELVLSKSYIEVKKFYIFKLIKYILERNKKIIHHFNFLNFEDYDVKLKFKE